MIITRQELTWGGAVPYPSRLPYSIACYYVPLRHHMQTQFGNQLSIALRSWTFWPPTITIPSRRSAEPWPVLPSASPRELVPRTGHAVCAHLGGGTGPCTMLLCAITAFPSAAASRSGFLMSCTSAVVSSNPLPRTTSQRLNSPGHLSVFSSRAWLPPTGANTTQEFHTL